jgi:hypothetical protein
VAVTTEAQSGVLGAAARIVLRGNACPVVHALLKGVRFVEVQIVTFPETKVAAIEHWGQASLAHDTVRKLVAWKLEQKLFDPAKYRSYGVHYTDPRTTPASEHHVGGPSARTWRQRFPEQDYAVAGFADAWQWQQLGSRKPLVVDHSLLVEWSLLSLPAVTSRRLRVS